MTTGSYLSLAPEFYVLKSLLQPQVFGQGTLASSVIATTSVNDAQAGAWQAPGCTRRLTSERRVATDVLGTNCEMARHQRRAPSPLDSTATQPAMTSLLDELAAERRRSRGTPRASAGASTRSLPHGSDKDTKPIEIW
jgi:hypothetical protein